MINLYKTFLIDSIQYCPLKYFFCKATHRYINVWTLSCDLAILKFCLFVIWAILSLRLCLLSSIAYHFSFSTTVVQNHNGYDILFEIVLTFRTMIWKDIKGKPKQGKTPRSWSGLGFLNLYSRRYLATKAKIHISVPVQYNTGCLIVKWMILNGSEG